MEDISRTEINAVCAGYCASYAAGVAAPVINALGSFAMLAGLFMPFCYKTKATRKLNLALGVVGFGLCTGNLILSALASSLCEPWRSESDGE